jgi:hypothetical protein
MFRWFFFLLFIFTGLFSPAQQADDILVPSSINIKLLEHLTKIGVDSVRKAHGLNPLINDPVLYLAAQDQADYLTRKNLLSHYQEDVKNKRTPQDRITFYGAKDVLSGENACLVPILVRIVDPKHKDIQEHTVSTYRQAANEMVTGWVNSPKHFANIITREYVITGLAVELNKETNTLRAVQVFGKLISPKTYGFATDKQKFPYENANLDSLLSNSTKMKQLVHHRHAWKIKKPVKQKHIENCKLCDQLIGGEEDIISEVKDDSLFFYFAKTTQFKQVFKKRKDGMALEIVNFDLYDCNDDRYYSLPSRRNNLCIFNGKE